MTFQKLLNETATAVVVEPDHRDVLAGANDEWTDTMTTLVEDPTLRSRLGRASRAKVNAGYSIEANAPRLREILERVTRYED